MCPAVLSSGYVDAYVKRYSLILIVQLVLALPLIAQQPVEQTRGSLGKGSTAKNSAGTNSDLEKSEQQRIRAVLQVRSFASQLLGFQDLRIKTQGIARLAELLWKDDQPYAEQLFLRALDLTSSERGASSKADSKTLALLRSQVLARIARCAPGWARQIASDEKSGQSDRERGASNFAIAYDLLTDDPEQAQKYAAASLKTEIGWGMVSFLLRLRSKDERAANALFLQVLETLVAQPQVDADVLLLLGTYLFTSQKMIGAEPDAIVQTVVGSLMVPDITGDRPNMSPMLVRSYISAGTNVLQRQPTDLRQQKLYYVACYLLASKAQKFAPEFLPTLTNAMQAIAKRVPAELTQEATYSNLKNRGTTDSDNLDNALREIERLPDDMRRDVRYLSLIFVLWTKGSFSDARRVASKISVLEVAPELDAVINFGEASRLLLEKTKDFKKIEELVEKLPEGLESAILRVGIARAKLDTGKRNDALEALERVMMTARKVDDSRRPFVILNVAALFSRFDKERAETLLLEAIREFNRQQPGTFTRTDWNRRIQIGPSAERFPLKSVGFEYQFDKALQDLFAANFDGTVAALRTLTNEQPLAAALVAASQAMLKPKHS